MHEHGNSLEAMIASLEKSPPVRVPGTAVYMSRALNVIPFALLHNLKHNKVLHERVILLTLRTEDAPYVHNVRRVQIEQLSPTFWWPATVGAKRRTLKKCSIAAVWKA